MAQQGTKGPAPVPNGESPQPAHRQDMPKFAGIFPDGTVAGELARAGGVHQALAAESHPVLIIPIGPELGFHIGQEVQQVIIMIRPVPASPVEDGIVQLPEHAGIVILYRAVHQGIQRPAQNRQLSFHHIESPFGRCESGGWKQLCNGGYPRPDRGRFRRRRIGT